MYPPMNGMAFCYVNGLCVRLMYAAMYWDVHRPMNGFIRSVITLWFLKALSAIRLRILSVIDETLRKPQLTIGSRTSENDR